MIIVINRRPTDNNRYHACVKGRPEIWAAGATQAEAVGDLITHHGEHFGLGFEFQGERWGAADALA